MIDGWRETTIRDEISLAYGRALPAREREAGDIPVFGSNGIVGRHSTAAVLGPGIIVGRKGSVGEVAFSSQSFWPIDTTYYVVNEGGHDWKFLFYLLVHANLTGLNSHSAVPGLNREDVYSIRVSVPDNAEQKEIAKALAFVESSIRHESNAVRTAIELKCTVKKRLFERGFGDELPESRVVGNERWPQSWKRALLGDVADVTWGDTTTTKASYVAAGFQAFSASGPDGFLPYADFSRTGVVLSAIGAQCGKTWLARGSWSCIKNTIRFWATDPGVDTEFLYWLTSDANDWARRGSAQPFISQGDARNRTIAYPPLSEQRGIIELLSNIDEKLKLHEQRRTLLNRLFRALLKELMTGRILASDLDLSELPKDDEPVGAAL